VARLAQKHGKGKALTLLAHKLARAVYYMLRRGQAFDVTKFFSSTNAGELAAPAAGGAPRPRGRSGRDGAASTRPDLEGGRHRALAENAGHEPVPEASGAIVRRQGWRRGPAMTASLSP
jgi:hypothetical protein